MTGILEQMREMDQSIWYDNIERKLLVDGTLAGKVERGEIRGITSNPSIFNKAISQSDEYDSDIKKYTQQGISSEDAYEKLAIQDIQAAADLFLPLYTESKGGDGYVSLEVNPYLAHDTKGTIKDAKRIWELVDRPNLMVKIPSTREGLPAITETIADGINVNVTLIFSLGRYNKVLDAYLAGLEKRLSAGKPISGIASVASFFISRIDSKVDQRLESLLTDSSPQEVGMIKDLLGKTAIASGKLAYVDYERTFGEAGTRFKPLSLEGAKRQRVLWASTSTKNPAYPDTKYVDGMIGPKTVNTIPPHTLEAFLDHGVVERTIDSNLDSARAVLEDIAALGIDLEEVTDELEKEGVKAFADAYQSLLDSLEGRMIEFRK
jgi:transaldolase